MATAPMTAETEVVWEEIGHTDNGETVYVAARCLKYDEPKVAWHITEQWLQDADPKLVKRDGPFVVLITGEAYELVRKCPRFPAMWDARILDKKGEV